jgi:hypothetical protein
VSKEALEQMKTMEDYYGKGLVIAPFDGKNIMDTLEELRVLEQ